MEGLETGARVVNYRDVTRVGTIVSVRRRWFPPGLQRQYVRWDGTEEPVPVRAGTWRVGTGEPIRALADTVRGLGPYTF